MAPTLLLMLLQIIITTCSFTRAATVPNFTSILIFGDSTVDTGNNNFIPTFLKGNFLPYGQDFPGRIPTGRFSNGKLIPDFIASFLGIKETVPPALDPNTSDNDIRTGVSFASAGSGYDNLTTVASNVIPVSRQLDIFKTYIAKLSRVVGNTEAKNIIGNSLVLVSAGTNDFGFNYYLLPVRRAQFDVSRYQDFLQNALQNYIKEIYNQGCRTFVIAGLPPMGCLPVLITTRLRPPLDRTCLEDFNADARSYNQKLVKLLPRLQASLPGSRILYADVYTPLIDMVQNPQKFGFTTVNRGCCGTGLVEASFLCNPATPTCGRPSQFLFWDSIHPTEATYRALADFLEKEVLQSFQ
ncbi:hypothetical protein DITRI_Ditri14bG0091200 [Diplodiscus trichospermus]